MDRCSKKGCDDTGTKTFSTYEGKRYYYCNKHYRFRYMQNKAQKSKKIIPTSKECEILLFVWCKDFRCPICNIKLKWHSNNHGRNSVISFQHNRDGTIMFICQGCNAGHGSSKLGDDYFKIPSDKKYCPYCDKILLKDKFYKIGRTKNEFYGYCKECDLLYRKRR